MRTSTPTKKTIKVVVTSSKVKPSEQIKTENPRESQTPRIAPKAAPKSRQIKKKLSSREFCNERSQVRDFHAKLTQIDAVARQDGTYESSGLMIHHIRLCIARLDFFYSFKGLKTTYRNKKVEDGYVALLRIFSAYSAIDPLFRSQRFKKEDHIKRFPILSAILPEDISEVALPRFSVVHQREIVDCKALKNTLLTYTEDKKLRSQIEQFFSTPELHKDRNFWLVAKAIRNLVSHGLLTVGGVRADSPYVCEALNKMADAIGERANMYIYEIISELCRRYKVRELSRANA